MATFIEKVSRLVTKISPKLTTQIRFYHNFKRFIDFKNPQTMHEKIHWLKFNTYKKNHLVRDCADKYLVRDYVKAKGCNEILNELYYAWDSVDEIDWDKLPNQFVIKWNFGCGHNIICFDKSTLNIKETEKKLREWYKEKNVFYLAYAEIHYKGIKPKLICEKLIETEDGKLPLDYKLYCINGKAASVMICSKRETGHPEYYFFDKNWKLVRCNKRGLEVPEGFTLPKPKNIEKVFEYAEKLSADFPFVRADFYLENGKVTFGELTFTPCGGYDRNFLPQTDLAFGKKIDLNYRSNM